MSDEYTYEHANWVAAADISGNRLSLTRKIEAQKAALAADEVLYGKLAP